MILYSYMYHIHINREYAIHYKGLAYKTYIKLKPSVAKKARAREK